MDDNAGDEAGLQRRPPRWVSLATLLAVAAAAGGAAVSLGELAVDRVILSSSPVTGNAPSGSTGSGAGTAPAASDGAAASTLTANVEAAVVDITTTVGYQSGTAAGTGLVLTSSGEVLTNNHVIKGATSIRVTDVGNGSTYSATVVGYDAAHDIAVLQLQGASGLTTATVGDSSTLTIGAAVVAIGNAGGVGGTPSSSSGTITGLDRSITASDASDGSSEQLTGLVETNAALQPGDSGGPLVDGAGKVIGIDTAASGGFRFQVGASDGYAIPINTALAIARQIESGTTSTTIHIGSTAFLGIEVGSAGGAGAASTSSGAVVAGVVSGSPAEGAGIAAGDVIVALGGHTVDSPSTLSTLLAGHHPGDRVQVQWVDQSGGQHTATVQLASGPAA
jgi:S1-C subfamily serine protease